MYSNMLAQLKALKMEKLLPRALELIPLVRLASGCPPLVTPTSQIVGVQAVNCALDELNGVSLYTTKSIQFVNLVKGVYGHTPVPVDPDFRFKLAGVKVETPYDTKFYKKQDNPVFEEYGGVRLALNEKEELLLELFPSVTRDFLKKRMEDTYLAEIHRVEEEKQKKLDEEKQKYNILSPEEKKKRLLDGLYNYEWQSSEGETIGLS
jgi:pyruvate/oxaloacetate carboxyltransferase